tara:strand:+ start:408 stop:824 length:417 start_codon:yes stop_codon:yes gene_type:complete
MSQDLTEIKKQLRNCEEIDTPYLLVQGNKVKYITLKDKQEYFYTATFVRMGDNKIFVKNEKSKISPVTLIYKDKDGSHIYKTRLFVEKENKCEVNQIENEKIIKNQQMIIEKMNVKMKQQEELIKQLHSKLLQIQNNQ